MGEVLAWFEPCFIHLCGDELYDAVTTSMQTMKHNVTLHSRIWIAYLSKLQPAKLGPHIRIGMNAWAELCVKRCPNLLTSIHEWKLTTRMPDLKDWFLQVPAFSHPNLHPGSPTRTSSKTTTVSYLTSRSWQITTSACKRSSEARVFACHNIKTSLCHDTSDGPTWNPLQVLLKSWELGITVHRSSLPKCRMPIHVSIAGFEGLLATQGA